MKKLLFVSLFGLTFTTSNLFAYDYTYTEDQHVSNGFESIYAGASVGILGGDGGEVCGDYDINCMSWKTFAGYRASEHWAFEGGFHSLIDGRASVTQQDMDISALSLSVLGIKSLSDFDMFSNRKDVEVFGKLGLAAWNSEVDDAREADGTDFLLGGGAQMKFSENLGIRGEMEYFGGDVDSTNYSAGMTYHTF